MVSLSIIGSSDTGSVEHYDLTPTLSYTLIHTPSFSVPIGTTRLLFQILSINF